MRCLRLSRLPLITEKASNTIFLTGKSLLACRSLTNRGILLLLFPMSDIDEVKSRLNIVDIISERVRLKKTGRNFKGLCPFHSEKTPSFIVSPDRQIFKCFGCGKGGSVIDFIMEN